MDKTLILGKREGSEQLNLPPELREKYSCLILPQNKTMFCARVARTFAPGSKEYELILGKEGAYNDAKNPIEANGVMAPVLAISSTLVILPSSNSSSGMSSVLRMSSRRFFTTRLKTVGGHGSASPISTGWRQLILWTLFQNLKCSQAGQSGIWNLLHWKRLFCGCHLSLFFAPSN